MELEKIEAELAAILEKSKQWLPAGQVADMAELVRAGEPGVALENLCTQLFEFDVVIPVEVHEHLGRLGEEMGVASDYWRRLTVNE